MEVIQISKKNYEQEVSNYQGKVLIDFWAPWCTPCRMLGPIVEEVAEERNDIKFCKVNVDEEDELASLFKVSSIPLLVIMENGKMTKSSLGYLNKESLLEFLK